MQWGDEDWKKLRDEKIAEWLPDSEAQVLLMLLSDIGETWDDLVDGDKPVTEASINKAFLAALFEVQENSFYKKHEHYLKPLIFHAITSWQASNTLRQGSISDRALAYTLRNMDIQILLEMIRITQGSSKAIALAPEVWRFFGADQDNALAWIYGVTK